MWGNVFIIQREPGRIRSAWLMSSKCCFDPKAPGAFGLPLLSCLLGVNLGEHFIHCRLISLWNRWRIISNVLSALLMEQSRANRDSQ